MTISHKDCNEKGFTLENSDFIFFLFISKHGKCQFKGKNVSLSFCEDSDYDRKIGDKKSTGRKTIIDERKINKKTLVWASRLELFVFSLLKLKIW